MCGGAVRGRKHMRQRMSQIFPSCESQRRKKQSNANAAAVRDAEFLPIGKSGSRNAGVGRRAARTDVHVRTAGAEACRNTALTDVKTNQSGNDVENAVKPPTHLYPQRDSVHLTIFNRRQSSNIRLDIERSIKRVILNELAPWLDNLAHKLNEKIVRFVGVLDLYTQQRASVFVQRCFP